MQYTRLSLDNFVLLSDLSSRCLAMKCILLLFKLWHVILYIGTFATINGCLKYLYLRVS